MIVIYCRRIVRKMMLIILWNDADEMFGSS